MVSLNDCFVELTILNGIANNDFMFAELQWGNQDHKGKLMWQYENQYKTNKPTKHIRYKDSS